MQHKDPHSRVPLLWTKNLQVVKIQFVLEDIILIIGILCSLEIDYTINVGRYKFHSKMV